MKRAMNTRSPVPFFALSFLFAMGLLAAPKASPFGRQQDQTDNTRMNKGDANKGATTADQQKMNPGDRAITQKIRAAIMRDKSLSTYAHNVKIITQNGKVTLKGPVRSQDEKAGIEGMAAAVAGDGNVTSHLEIAPPQS